MFKTNTPVTHTSFFNRQYELEILGDAVRSLDRGNPKWFAILGTRKIGKTSLILELKRQSNLRRTAFVVLDTNEEQPLSLNILKRYLLRTLDALYSKQLGQSLEALVRSPEHYRAALARSGLFADLDAAHISLLMELPDKSFTWNEVEISLQLPELLSDKIGMRILVAWDEFQMLAGVSRSRSTGDIFMKMRTVWQTHQNIGYVISGSEKSLLRELIVDPHAPFFQHFSTLELGSFSKKDAVDLLVKSSPKKKPIPVRLAQKVYSIVGGNPFYLQMLGESLTQKEPPYDDGALKQVFSELVFSRSGRLSLYFENRFLGAVGRSTYLAAVLASLARGDRRLSEIARRIGATAGATSRYIERLGDTVVRDNEGNYFLSDRVFGLWVEWRQPGGTVIPMTVIGDEAEKQVAVELAGMGFDLIYQSRASRGSFDILATRGEIALGVQVKASLLPLRFKKREWQRFSADAKRLGWRFVIASVAPSDSAVHFLDPGLAQIGRQIKLDEASIIDNLLRWVG